MSGKSICIDPQQIADGAVHWRRSGDNVTFLMTQSLDPFRFLQAVVSGWMNQQHLRYLAQPDEFSVEFLDAPRIALGEMPPLQPDLSAGIPCSLLNNAWGTNYVRWFGGDMRFRFLIRA